jgi:hypothetical protein
MSQCVSFVYGVNLLKLQDTNDLRHNITREYGLLKNLADRTHCDHNIILILWLKF